MEDTRTMLERQLPRVGVSIRTLEANQKLKFDQSMVNVIKKSVND